MIAIHPLTPARWTAFEALFEAQGVTRDCWCMWWRVTAQNWRAGSPEDRRDAFRNLCQTEPPGLLALDGDSAVGWVQITPRAAIPRFGASRAGRAAPGTDPAAVWAVSCFFVTRSHRRQGLMTRLARAACEHARDRGAQAVEAAAHLPADRLQWSDGFTGMVPALARAGFVESGPRQGNRVPMRWTPPPG
ncbi:MAG: GNAT family N-acetyltransferase [Roseivivax sp.]|nr:GNAT family N-acetyltransferase [Roseivivax sp.]